eukprot:2713938-Rhodomonas_salina.1
MHSSIRRVEDATCILIGMSVLRRVVMRMPVLRRAYAATQALKAEEVPASSIAGNQMLSTALAVLSVPEMWFFAFDFAVPVAP